MSDGSARASAVVDTNLFVSGAISPQGSPRRLLTAWLSRRFRLFLSGEQSDELDNVFARPKLRRLFQLSPDELAEIAAALAAPRVTPVPTLPLPVRDPKDEHVLAAALGANVEYLVTGDNDLLALAGDPRLGPLQIVTVVEFLAVLDRRGPD